jgi:hypothetical protein
MEGSDAAFQTLCHFHAEFPLGRTGWLVIEAYLPFIGGDVRP